MNFFKSDLDRIIATYERGYKDIEQRFKESSIGEEFDEHKMFIISHKLDLATFKNLYKKYFLPAAKNAARDVRKAVNKTSLRGSKLFSEKFCQNNLHETIQQGYVVLYHKHEKMLDSYSKLTSYKKIKNLETICWEKYGLKLRKPNSVSKEDRRPESIKEIEWICDSYKHGAKKRDGSDMPYKFTLIQEQNSLTTEKDFFNHIDVVEIYWENLFRIFPLIELVEVFEEHPAMIPLLGDAHEAWINTTKAIIKSRVSMLENL